VIQRGDKCGFLFEEFYAIVVPFGRGKMPWRVRFGCLALLMSAHDAHCPYFLPVGFFRYYVLANSHRRGNNRPLTLVTTKDCEVEIPFHANPSPAKIVLVCSFGFSRRYVWSQLLFLP
jgi:hypothetical protein